MYKRQAIDSYIILGVPFPLLKKYIQIPIYGQQTKHL